MGVLLQDYLYVYTNGTHTYQHGHGQGHWTALGPEPLLPKLITNLCRISGVPPQNSFLAHFAWLHCFSFWLCMGTGRHILPKAPLRTPRYLDVPSKGPCSCFCFCRSVVGWLGAWAAKDLCPAVGPRVGVRAGIVRNRSPEKNSTSRRVPTIRFRLVSWTC